MVIGTFSGPPLPTGGSASANEYSTIQELLYKLPDNDAGIIKAKDVRDSVYTLWERVSDVEIVASQSASASSYYTNLTPTLVSNGGISVGSTFSNATMQQMWDALLYPYIAPSASLSGGFTREYGASNILTLSWSVIKNSEDITTIVVNGTPIVVTGGSQSGTQSATATQNVNTTHSMTVSDIPNGTSNVSATTLSTWSNRIYWGTIASNHTLATVSGAAFSHSTIMNNSSISSELSNTYVQTRTITTNYDYVVFIFPHDNSVDLSTNPPRVKVSGFGNNNWVKTRSNVSFTNQFGYTGTNYDVWIFGNTQAPNTFTYEII